MGHGWPPVNKSYQFGLRPTVHRRRRRCRATCSPRCRPSAPNGRGSTRSLGGRHRCSRHDPDGGEAARDRDGQRCPCRGPGGPGSDPTPGKKADIVVIDATAINVAPVHDPVAAVTLCADVSNVEHVIVDGEFASGTSSSLPTSTGRARWSKTHATSSSTPPRRRRRRLSTRIISSAEVRRRSGARWPGRCRLAWPRGLVVVLDPDGSCTPALRSDASQRAARCPRMCTPTKRASTSWTVGSSSRHPARRCCSAPAITAGFRSVSRMLRNIGDVETRWARMSAPTPRVSHGLDTYVVA